MEGIKYAIKNSKGLYLRAGSSFRSPEFGVLGYAYLSIDKTYPMMLMGSLKFKDCKIVKIRIEEVE